MEELITEVLEVLSKTKYLDNLNFKLYGGWGTLDNLIYSVESDLAEEIKQIIDKCEENSSGNV